MEQGQLHIVQWFIMENGSYDKQEKQEDRKIGEDGINRQTGGGASGYANATGANVSVLYKSSANAYGGAGAKGTSYSGGDSGQNAVAVAKSLSSWDKQNSYVSVSGKPGLELGGTGGGLLVIYSNSILNNGIISSNGKNKGTFNDGGTGGGSINLFYTKEIKAGIISAIGGSMAGGNGSVTSTQI